MPADGPPDATLCQAFQRTVAVRGDAPALQAGDALITWRQYGTGVERAAAALSAAGVVRGDTVGLMLVNRPEFHVLDMAALHVGATPFSIYNSSPPEQIAERLENSGCRLVITERALAAGVLEAASAEVRVFVVDEPVRGAQRWTTAVGDALDFEAKWRAVAPTDLATLVYTSGTTGAPKGVQLTHDAMLAMARRFLPWIEAASTQERFISYLPMAHVGERMLAHYGHAVWGFQVTCCPDPKLMLGMLTEVRPTAFFAPPRVFEKLRAAIVAGGEEDAAPTLRALGLDAVRCAVSSGAPVPAELIRFHNQIGLPLVEGYGSSELGGIAACNRPGESKIGSAGPALPGFEARIARDGELEMRGPSMMIGYRGRVQETAAALGPDGWLRTGDIAELDDDGCLRIVDRKKEIIINAMGKNMSPANIESALKSACPMIGQVCCVGDSRPYNVALIALDPEAVGDVERAAGDQRVLAELADGVRRANSRLSRVEQIKRHAVLGTEWLPDSDELTATMKLKRRAIATKYAPEIDALYHAQSETSASGLQHD